MTSIFTRIIKGEIPCYKIFEDEQVFAFLDINPVSKGHTLLIPKVEVDYYFDLEEDLLAHLSIQSKNIANAIREATSCERVGVAVVGLEVPHAHVHLIPINQMSDFSFSGKKLKLSPEEFESLAKDIRSRI